VALQTYAPWCEGALPANVVLPEQPFKHALYDVARPRTNEFTGAKPVDFVAEESQVSVGPDHLNVFVE
jgi:hypothetical protein